MGIVIRNTNQGGRITFRSLGLGGRITSTVSPSALLLDIYPGAAAAYSLRKLRTAYNGSAIRVRRSNDNAETDIGFVNNELDTVSLNTFVGANSGFITTWYDQSGNGINATQSTSANQPRIVLSGVIETQLLKPAIKFTNSNGNGFTTTLSLNNPFSMISVLSQDITATLASTRIIQSSTNNSLISLKRPDNLSIYTNATVISNFTSQISNQSYLISFLRQTTTSYVYQNGASISNSSTSSENWGTVTIGGVGLFSGEPFLGKISELVIYGSNKNSDIPGIHGNINSFYTIY
jgi:hypothetical protein